MTNDVDDLISALREGSVSLDQLAQTFRDRVWPRAAPEPATTYSELAEREQQDPEPYVPGSFDDVAAAFHRGDLSRDEYEVLANAAADSMRAEDERRTGGVTDSE